jgi:catechol 2,3-dioxygenase-like lactoylglutathione lyase family enzyme
MITGITQITLIVREYDEAKNFYCGKLGFSVVEDIQLEDKRRLRIRAPGGVGSDLVLSKAANEKQLAQVGNQSGGRVLFFLGSSDFDSDYRSLTAKGVKFVEGPFTRPHGKVAIFEDLYGNRLDLVEPA